MEDFYQQYYTRGTIRKKKYVALPNLNNVHFKAKITKRNEWIVKNSDVVVCYIKHTENSGTYKMLQTQ